MPQLLESSSTRPQGVWWQALYVQVLAGIVLGVLLGHFYPHLGAQLKPLGDGFIKLVKMIIAPVIFLTIVAGIARMGDLKHVGKIGVKALIYFEILTTLALLIGLVVANVVQPGVGMTVAPADLANAEVEKFRGAAGEQGVVSFLLNVIPNSFVSAFTEGQLLQVLLIALLSGVALTRLGATGQRLLTLCDDLSQAFFGMVEMIMRLAPIGAFGAMAYTIGKFGVGSLLSLGLLLVCVYATCFAFVFVVLGAVARWSGFSLWQLLKYLRGELLLVLGTSSSESALPRLLLRLEDLGCARGVVGLVLPTGYSFNLDGTCIYLTLAAMFVAQAMGVQLSLGEQLTLLAVLLLTSKGAAGVTGSGFVTLTATLAALGGKVPVEGVALILGIDRFLSEARALTNVIGNAVACMVVARWEGMRDDAQMQQAFSEGPRTLERK